MGNAPRQLVHISASRIAVHHAPVHELGHSGAVGALLGMFQQPADRTALAASSSAIDARWDGSGGVLNAYSVDELADQLEDEASQ
jgi:hypothetical protein